MTGSKSKQKGNAFEREVAIFLSTLYGGSFVRAPHSGAYIGGKNNIRKNTLSDSQSRSFKGDIIPPDEWINFNAELKSYASFPFHQLFTGECKQLDTWIEQTLAVAEPDDLSVIFIKITRTGKFVCVPAKYTWMTDCFMYYSSKKHGDWIIIDFDHFFKYNKDIFKAYSGSTQAQQTPSHD